jgi:hypothetical protein
MVNKLGKSSLFLEKDGCSALHTEDAAYQNYNVLVCECLGNAKAWEIGNQGLHDSTLARFFAAQDVSWTLTYHHILEISSSRLGSNAGTTGFLAGGGANSFLCTLVDIKAKLFDGSYHDVDSNEMAFKIAASMALKNAASKCKPVILEPIMKVEVVIPEDYLGDIMGDITSRRGRVEGMEARGNTQMVKAMVPLSEMFGYATSLRSNTQGRGTFSMHFDHYEEVPKSISEEIIKKNKGE